MAKQTVHQNANKNLPYRENSLLGRAWKMCVAGASIKELTKLCNKEGCNLPWLLRTMRSGKRFGWTWKTREDAGKLKIYDAKKP
jgi:hypothetical protein